MMKMTKTSELRILFYPMVLRVIFSLLFACMIFPVPSQAVDMCPPGYVLYTPVQGPDICLPCNPGTFISGGYHTLRSCHDCSRIENPDIEVMYKDCSTTHDSLIRCIDGYYWEKSSSPDTRGQCRTCSSCQFPKLPCDRFRDTVCCPGDNYDVVTNKDGIPVCVQLCGRGEFYDSGTDKCESCPKNSYMDEDRHTHTHCLPCQWIKSESEVITHHCSRTHPAVIGCKVGWYKRTSPDFPYTTCVPCQRCSGENYEGRVCSGTHDAVCCEKPGMTVMDTPEGPKCVHAASVRATDSTGCPRLCPEERDRQPVVRVGLYQRMSWSFCVLVDIMLEEAVLNGTRLMRGQWRDGKSWEYEKLEGHLKYHVTVELANVTDRNVGQFNVTLGSKATGCGPSYSFIVQITDEANNDREENLQADIEAPGWSIIISLSIVLVIMTIFAVTLCYLHYKVKRKAHQRTPKELYSLRHEAQCGNLAFLQSATPILCEKSFPKSDLV